MLEEFWVNVQFGVNHIFDLNGYDHILFLLVLSVPYLFNNWKRVLLLVTVFTVGHTLSLVLATYDVVKIDDKLVEFLIPMTILVVAIYNVFTSGKKAVQNKIGVLLIATLFFGLIHGLGFARAFKVFIGKTESKLVPILEFALGIEFAQIIIVFVAVFIGFLGQTVFRFSRRDWIMVVSAIVIGLTIPMIINSELIA